MLFYMHYCKPASSVLYSTILTPTLPDNQGGLYLWDVKSLDRTRNDLQRALALGKVSENK